MAEVSKVVRDRLARAPVAGPHPDADLLTAFAERTLAAREREQVMAHLATCAGCREVVALAAPATAPAQEAPVVTAKPRWLSVPMLRWGAVTAVVLVAAAVILESPRYATQEQKVASLQKQDREMKTFSSPTPPASTSSATPAQAEPKAAGPAANEEKGEAIAALKKDKKDAQPVETAKLAEPQGLVRRRDNEAFAMDKVAPAAPPAAGAGAASQPAANAPRDAEVAVTAQAAPVAKPAEARPQSSNDITMARAAAAPMSSAKAAPAKTQSKNAEDEMLYGSNDSFAAGNVGALNGARLEPASYRWTVTSDGRVQRSLDGRNWYYVPVAKGVVFRALTNDGLRVWAGGNNAALYYSPDAGNTWKKQSIERLQGDIIRLVINNNTLTITTSSGQTMDVSSDGWTSDTGPRSNSPR